MKLRRTILGRAAGAVLALGGTRGAVAQIYDQYQLTIQPRVYTPQIGRGTPIQRNQFRNLFAPSVVDADDGVAGPITLPFPFEYNNQVYTQIYICVNGWISFQNPGAYITNDPFSLFTNARPNLTVAPYFGDHYYRDLNGFDNTDPSGRRYTQSAIRVVSVPSSGPSDPARFVIEWENMNVNYRFDPTDPDNPFAPVANVQPQASSVASFQVHLIQAPSGSVSQQGDIEFHYGPVGSPTSTGGIVKLSGASVGIEDEPAVPGGATTFMNAVAFRENGGSTGTPSQRVFDSTIQSRRLSKVWPPTGFPGQAFIFTGNRVRRIDNWGDGDADLTQLDVTVPQFIRDDQRRFVTFIDVIRVLRHAATRGVAQGVQFDSTYGRHAFHADVNHNGRFYYSTRNYNNTADSVINGNIIRYKRLFPTRTVNYQLPFPNDNSFSGFLFDADQQDAALIMLFLAAKLPTLPWLYDTLPSFGKNAAMIAHDVRFGRSAIVTGTRVEIPVTFEGYLNGALGVAMDAANGTRIVEVHTMPKRSDAWVEAVATDDRVTIAAAGSFRPEDVIATLVVEASDKGDVTFSNVQVGDQSKGMRKLNVFGAVAGAASTVSLSQNVPNPFSPNSGTTIGYGVPADGKVLVRVFDLLGREVRTLVSADLKAGSYQTEWDGRDAEGNVVESGMYYYRIEAAGQSLTKSVQVRK
jgi:hypothetical protein